MNKTAVLACAALFAAGLSANAAEVTSRNVVGYQKITLNPGYTMIGIPFVEVGTGGTLSILDMFENFEGATADSSAAAADQIQVWTGTSYDTYYYKANKKGSAWYVAGGDEVTDQEIPNGGAFYLARAAVSFQLKSVGEVSTEPKEYTVVTGYNLLGNPFPVDIKISSLVADGQTADSSAAAADQIQVWTGSSYDTYYYKANKKGSAWYAAGADEVTDNDVIKAGTSFFYLSRAAESFTLTIESPIAE